MCTRNDGVAMCIFAELYKPASLMGGHFGEIRCLLEANAMGEHLGGYAILKTEKPSIAGLFRVKWRKR